MTITTTRCPECGHPNLPSASRCLKCNTALHDDPESETALELAVLSHSPLPWVVTGFGFLMAVMVGFMVMQNQQSATPAPRYYSSFAPPGEAPPPAEAEIVSETLPVMDVAPAPNQANDSQSAQWHTIADFSGSGTQRTQIFDVRASHWRIGWSTAGTTASRSARNTTAWFYGFLYRNDGKKIGHAVNGKNQDKGLLYMHGVGKFYMDVNATQQWTLKIEEWR